MSDASLRKLYPWFTVLGLTVGALVVAAFYKDQQREWKDWQRAYIRQELAKATTEEQRKLAASIPVEIKQVVLPELRRVDRCITCHVAVDDPSYAGFPQPLSYHPNHAQHPIERFGCTVCHQGQGYATTRDAAHGHVKFWDHPMLPMKYIEASCAKCHHPSDLPNAPKLARGRQVFEEQGCIGCHKLGGIGAAIGPELDKVGAKRSPDWLMAHFKNPAASVPGSAMPPVKLKESDLEALTIYMLGQTGEKLSDYHVSMRTIPGPQVGQRIFETKGCIGCHSIGGRGGKVGPELDKVAERRDAEWIVRHFKDPQAVSPGTVMPKFDFTEQEIRALTEFLLSLSDPNVVGYVKLPVWTTPIERGKAVYRKYGCAGCHGPNAEGGVPNPNSKTAEQVPGLKFVAEGYTKAELARMILDGQKEIAPMDPKRPPPPLYMPGWKGKIDDGELKDLIEYLMSLMPKDEGMEF